MFRALYWAFGYAGAEERQRSCPDAARILEGDVDTAQVCSQAGELLGVFRAVKRAGSWESWGGATAGKGTGDGFWEEKGEELREVSQAEGVEFKGQDLRRE